MTIEFGFSSPTFGLGIIVTNTFGELCFDIMLGYLDIYIIFGRK